MVVARYVNAANVVAPLVPVSGVCTGLGVVAVYSINDHGASGYGRLHGTVERAAAPANIMLRRRVCLVRESDMQAIAETWSDATTGAWEFTHVALGVPFTVISYDGPRQYRAVIADHQLAEPM